MLFLPGSLFSFGKLNFTVEGRAPAGPRPNILGMGMGLPAILPLAAIATCVTTPAKLLIDL